jgi:SAM-dependent methyltransferase
MMRARAAARVPCVIDRVSAVSPNILVVLLLCSTMPSDAGIQSMDTCERECRICRATGPHAVHHARELMHGTRDRFDYFECAECGTVQIGTVPAASELARYYPQDYYSFEQRRKNWLVRWLVAQRDRHVLNLPNLAGALIGRFRVDPILRVLARANLKLSDRILDVGCGSGRLLDRLARAGFPKLIGVDPFIAGDMRTPAGVPIRKALLSEVSGTFDVIMFNHSLEHVTDPVGVLRDAGSHLALDGKILVRVPTPSSDAWQIYGIDWVQLDAPRHIVLPSRKGAGIMAEHAGLSVRDVIDDSGTFQFTGSEQYRRDLPLRGAEPDALFSRADLARFAARAAALNACHRGDQAMFVLRRAA